MQIFVASDGLLCSSGTGILPNFDLDIKFIRTWT